MHIYILLFLALFIILFVILKKKTREGNTGSNIGVMPIQVATEFNIDDAINTLQNKCNRGDIPACKYIAKKQGFSLGGGGYNFDGAYHTNGLYTYNNGSWKGMAFFGTRAGTNTAKNSTSLSGGKKRINTTDRNNAIKDKNQCWKKMPTGCTKRLSETKTPKNWFIDYHSLDANTCDSRKDAFNRYCGKRDAEGSWSKYPEKLDECAGHCDIDADCKDGLICSTKIQEEDWPRCSKDIEENKKYCKNEQKNAEMNEISKGIYETFQNIKEGMTSSEIIIPPTDSPLIGVFTNAKEALENIEKMLVAQEKISQDQNCNNNNGIKKKKKFLNDIFNLIDTDLLKQIIGFSIKDEMKLMKLIDGLNKNYRDLKDCTGSIPDNPEYFKIKNKIIALKIIKWHISMSYIKYFDESTYNNIKDIEISPPIISGEEGVKVINDAMREVFPNVKNYLMNKLNIAIDISYNLNDPAGELTTFMKANLTNNTLNACSMIDESYEGKDCVNPRSDIFDKKIILSSPKTEVELDNLIRIFPKYFTFEGNLVGGKRMNKTNTRDLRHPPGAYFKKSDMGDEITVYWGSAITNEFTEDDWKASKYLPAKFPLWGLDLTVEKCGPIQSIKSMKATNRNDDYNLWLERCSELPLDKCSSKTEWTAPRPMGSGGRCQTEGFINMEKIIKQNKIVQKINTFKQNRFNDVMSFFKKNVLKTGIIEGLGFNTTKTTNVNIYFSKGDSDDTLINSEIGKVFYSIYHSEFQQEIGDRWYKYNLKASVSMDDNDWQLNGIVKEILVKIYDDRDEIFKAVNTATKVYTDRNITISTDNDAGWGIPSSKDMSWYQQNLDKIYKSDLLNLVDWGTVNTGGTVDTGGSEVATVNPIKEKLKTASINLYVNDDGYSFITVIPIVSSEGQVWLGPNSNEDELIKKVILDIKTLKLKNQENEQKYYFYGSKHKNETGYQGFSTETPVKCRGEDQCEPYPLIADGRSLMIMPRGMFYIKFSDITDICKDIGFDPNTDGGNSQTCKGTKYDTLCRLNYVSPVNTDKTGYIPRCYNADGKSLNTELAPYEKTCAKIPGMKADQNDPHKCITDDSEIVGGKNLFENELRSCYLYNKDTESRIKCDPKKEKNEDDCLCIFENTGTDGVTLVGKPIVEDSVCEVLGDTDLTYSECAEYASLTNGQIENKFFNIDGVGVGYRRGCQEMLDGTDAGNAKNKFYYVAPNKRYGTQTEVRKWGDDELETLDNLQNRLGGNRNICKITYLDQKRDKVATEIGDGETPLDVKNITIPGIRDDKTSSGNYLITNVTKTERDYAKLNCDAKNSWDSCYMQGNQTSLNEGERLVEDAGYSEFKLYPEEADTTEADTTEGFMGFRKTIREGLTSGSSGCLKNCAPRRFTNGNCDEDIKTTKTVDGIQRFFKMCPQECLGPTPQGTESNGYEDIDKGGTVGPDGATITYDAAIHGCRTSKQCEETCNKSAIQMKHVYENGCNDEDECTHSKLFNQYVPEKKDSVDGQIKFDSTIKITNVSLTDDLIRKYNKEGGMAQKLVDGVQQNDNGLINEGNDSRDRAIFKFIEGIKKKSVSQIIGFSYESKTDANPNPSNNLRIIYKKANVFAKINITPNTTESWKTYIHKRKWEDYWYDPNRPTMVERNLTEREMQRMQGIDLGISMDAFDKIPLYWQNSKTKEANFDDICEWVDGKIKAGELKPKDKCSDSFKSSWASRTLGIGKSPSKGMNFEDFEQVFNLRQTAVQGSSYTDMTNNMDIGQTDLSLDDYYKRNLLKSKVENRLGGSDNAYTKTYKPLNPDARPKFFNSAWGLFH